MDNQLMPNLISVRMNSSIGSDNGLVPFRRQAIIWTNDVHVLLMKFVAYNVHGWFVNLL